MQLLFLHPVYRYLNQSYGLSKLTFKTFGRFFFWGSNYSNSLTETELSNTPSKDSILKGIYLAFLPQVLLCRNFSDWCSDRIMTLFTLGKIKIHTFEIHPHFVNFLKDLIIIACFAFLVIFFIIFFFIWNMYVFIKWKKKSFTIYCNPVELVFGILLPKLFWLTVRKKLF